MPKKPAPKNEKSTAAQTSMLPAEGRLIRPVPLSDIQPDPRQPRGDDEKKAANVSNICDTLIVDKEGVARPLHAVQIRHTPPWADDQKRPWMLFDGECRYLSATIKGAASILAVDVDIPEDEVFEAQVMTAMARDGLGPSAVLEALRRFDIEHPDVNAVNAAARLGMKTDVVRSLRKVNLLPTEVRLRFMGGEHTLEVCDSISRIEGATPEERAERQRQASKAVAGMAPKKAREYIMSQFLLRLATAPFDRADLSLNPAAGACSTCPHRTGAQLGLGLAEADAAEDCCTLASCWAIKVAATVAKNPPPEEEEKKAKPKASNKPTVFDVSIAAALAKGDSGLELDAKFGGNAQEIDASLERLAAHGNPKAGPALQDRRAVGKDIGGYSCGSAHALAAAALDATRDAMARLTASDAALFMRGVVGVAGGFLTFTEPGAPTCAACAEVEHVGGRWTSHTCGKTEDASIESVACEPGGEPPPPPPVAAPGWSPGVERALGGSREEYAAAGSGSAEELDSFVRGTMGPRGGDATDGAFPDEFDPDSEFDADET